MPCSSTPKSCRRCETLPAVPSGPGHLHLRLPQTHIVGKLRAHLEAGGQTFQERAGIFVLEAPGPDLTAVLAPLVKVFTPREQHDVQVLFRPSDRVFELADSFDVASLDAFFARAQSGWLLAMIEEQRLFAEFQPIVQTGVDGERIYAYECLLRGTDADGSRVFPGRIFDVGRGAGMLFQLDLAARRAAIRDAARHGIESKIFINFTPSAIYDPAFCLRSTMAYIDEVGLRRDQIVFEVVESDHVLDPEHLKRILDFYREAGFGVALDDVGSGYSSLGMLSELRPDYIKLDMRLTKDVHLDDYKAVIAQKLIETARGLGLDVVAEGVETAGESEWLMRHGAPLQQGYFFAKPATPPPALRRAAHA